MPIRRRLLASAVLAVCAFASLGFDGCEGTPPENALAFPVVRFTIPSEEELTAAEADFVVLQGAVCANGPPAGVQTIVAFLTGESDVLDPCPKIVVDPETGEVEEFPDNEGRFISVEILIEDQPENPNLNPTVEDVTLDGDPWPPPFEQGVPRDQSDTDCADLVEDRSVLPVADGSISLIELGATGSSFQQYSVDDRVMTEEMQVTWLADGGAFESSFSFIADPARSAVMQWAPPNFPPASGRVVRFNFVIRDDRGGIDRVERGLCVVP